MTKPVAFDPETMAALILGGQVWPIPDALGWRTLSKCRAQLIELTDRINDAALDDALQPPAGVDEAGETSKVEAGRNLMIVDRVLRGLSNEDYERLVVAPLYAAAVALHPTLTRAEFDELPVTEAERQWSWLTLRRHSQTFSFSDEAQASGEADGVAQAPTVN